MHGVTPLRPNMKMAGPAFTLRYIPAREDLDTGEIDNLKDAQRVGIEKIGVGEVFVIDARGDTRAGTMGDILATRIYNRGAAGVVTDGAFRDSPSIAEIGLPAFSAAMNAHSNKTYITRRNPSAHCLRCCHGLPGDIIVGGRGRRELTCQFMCSRSRTDCTRWVMHERASPTEDSYAEQASSSYPPDESTPSRNIKRGRT